MFCKKVEYWFCLSPIIIIEYIWDHMCPFNHCLYKNQFHYIPVSILTRMLWYEQIFEFDFCQLWQGGELYLHEYFQKKISKNSKTSQFKPFLCLPSIGTYSYKEKFLHFGNAAPVAHKFIPEQFPSHEAHKIWCMMGSYLQIWIKSTFTIISQGPQNSHIYPF